MFKATTEQIKEAQVIATRLGVSTLYVNDKGEFFSSENAALQSVEGDSQRLQIVEARKAVAGNEADEDGDDLALELAEIKALNTVDDVDAMLSVEEEGANRAVIVAALMARREELEAQDDQN